MAKAPMISNDGQVAGRKSGNRVGRPFEKGKSGNPGGRPREIGEVRALAQAQTEASIRALVSIRDSKKAPAAARVVAANSLLDRAWGKPQQTLTGDGDQSITIRWIGADE